MGTFRKELIALFAVASIGMLAPDAAMARGGIGGGSHGGNGSGRGGIGGFLRVADTAAFTTSGHDSVWAQLGGSGFLRRITTIIPMPGMTMAIMAIAIS